MALTRPRAYQIYDIDYKQAVRVVTTTNITLAGGAPNTVDGISLAANNRVLVTGQSTASENGIYFVSTVGSGSNGTWERSIDTNSTGELLSGTIVMVTEGNVFKDTQWKLTTDDPITIGSSDLVFVQNYSANSISAGTSNVVVTSNGAVTISSAGSPNVLTVNSGSISVTANIYPTANITYDLGNTTNRFKDIWLSNGTIYLGNIALSADATSLLVNGSNVVTETDGSISVTGNIDTAGALNINSATGNYNVLNISGTALAPYGGSQTWKFFTQNITSGGPGSWILFPDTSTQTTAYPGTSTELSLVGNIDGGNINTAGNVTGNYFVGSTGETYIKGQTLIRLAVNGEEFDFTSDSFNVNYANITSSGNITGNYIIGNGSQLTGLPAGYANSDVAVYLASGDDTANIVTTGNVSGTYILGNVAFATGIPATYGNSNVSAYLASGDNTANIITTGNIAGTYFLGNANIQYTASSTEPTGNLIGAQWYNTSNDVLYEWQTDGTSSYWIDISGPVIGSNGAASGTTLTNGTSNISVALDSNATVNIGGTADIVVWSTTGEYVTGVVSATGNITSSANITGGNLITGGLISATGNVGGSNMIAAGAIYSNYNTNTANIGSFMATGGNTKGGTGYLDFLVAQNTSGGSTNPYKWFRLNPTGAIEIINSEYTATLLTLTDAGAFSVASTVSSTGFNVNNKQAVNGPAFRAYVDGSQSITSGSQQKVTFGSETFDTNGNFSSSRFTPTVEGYYQLNATVRISGTSGTGEVMITIWKNGSEYARGTNEGGSEQGSNWYSMQVSDLAYANGSTDYFEIYIQQSSGGNRDTTAGQNISYFSGAMVRGA